MSDLEHQQNHENNQPHHSASSAKPKASLLSAFTSGQSFVVGLAAGVLVLCTIGFVVMLTLYFKSPTGSNYVGKLTADQVADITAADQGTPNAGGPKIIDLASQIGLNTDKFKTCVKEAKFATKVKTDEAEGQAAGGQGTPYSIVIGPKGETIPINGAQPFQVVEGVIKQLLGQKVDAPAGALPTAQTGITIRPVDVKKEPFLGNAKAKITIVEFSDFECPFCKRFHQTMEQVMQTYGNDIKWVYRHFPLDGLHQKARTEALAAECAGDQGKFWEFTNGVFAVTPSNDGMDITL